MARLISEGIGTKADLVKAWALASLAQERGDKDAQKMVDEISSKLDDAQKAAAKKELADMKSVKPSETKSAVKIPEAALKTPDAPKKAK